MAKSNPTSTPPPKQQQQQPSTGTSSPPPSPELVDTSGPTSERELETREQNQPPQQKETMLSNFRRQKKQHAQDPEQVQQRLDESARKQFEFEKSVFEWKIEKIKKSLSRRVNGLRSKKGTLLMDRKGNSLGKKKNNLSNKRNSLRRTIITYFRKRINGF